MADEAIWRIKFKERGSVENKYIAKKINTKLSTTMVEKNREMLCINMFLANRPTNLTSVYWDTNAAQYEAKIILGAGKKIFSKAELFCCSVG